MPVRVPFGIGVCRVIVIPRLSNFLRYDLWIGIILGCHLVWMMAVVESSLASSSGFGNLWVEARCTVAWSISSRGCIGSEPSACHLWLASFCLSSLTVLPLRCHGHLKVYILPG